MPTLVVVLGSLAAAAALLGGLPWLAARVRRHGTGGSPLTALDEIWHPAAHQARTRIEIQDERVTPAPPPGDRPAPAGPDGHRPDRAGS